MVNRSIVLTLAAIAGFGAATLAPGGAFAFARLAGGVLVASNPIVRAPGFHGNSIHEGRFAFYRGAPTPVPQMKCIPRQMRKLFALDPNADPDFVAATAAHLCGVRDAG
jgi:hypothetical protein